MESQHSAIDIAEDEERRRRRRERRARRAEEEEEEEASIQASIKGFNRVISFFAYLFLEAGAVVFIIRNLKGTQDEISTYLISYALVTLPSIFLIIGIACCTPKDAN